MGKFFDALRKAESAKGKQAPSSTSEKVVELPTEKIDSLRLESKLGENPLARRKEFAGKFDPRLISVLDPQSPGAEVFKLLRAKIFCKDLICQGRTILVTSAQPLDGKSFVSANLAVSIAQGINESVLLVDCDLRRPSQHNLFALRTHQGLSEYLEDGSSIAPFLVKTPLEKLTILPAGTPPLNPSELLASKKMGLLIDEIRSRYSDRYVIFDASPAKFTPELTSLALKVDGILLVVRAGKTPVQLVSDVIANLGREKILGLVFNASKDSQKHYRYYQSYYSKHQPK